MHVRAHGARPQQSVHDTTLRSPYPALERTPYIVRHDTFAQPVVVIHDDRAVCQLAYRYDLARDRQLGEDSRTRVRVEHEDSTRLGKTRTRQAGGSHAQCSNKHSTLQYTPVRSRHQLVLLQRPYRVLQSVRGALLRDRVRLVGDEYLCMRLYQLTKLGRIRPAFQRCKESYLIGVGHWMSISHRDIFQDDTHPFACLIC
jgi:hypothetical protein